jgi:hypothetical protein
MRLIRPFAGILACLALFTVEVRAEPTPDPLRFVPERADLVLEVRQPRLLVETGLSLDAFKALQALPPVRDAYDSTTARRLYQLLYYFEKQLGVKWPDMLDRIGGGGLALAVKIDKGPNSPALLVIQGKDEAMTAKFYKLALDVIGQELERQESKDKVVAGNYNDIPTAQVGKEFHAALVGTAIVVSNKEDFLKSSLDLSLGKDKNAKSVQAKVEESRQTLPKDPLANLWLNLETVRRTSPETEALFKAPRDPVLTIGAGGLLDVIGRSPFVCAGLYQNSKEELLLTVRMPRGREGSGPDFALHVPPPDGPGLPPLLEPKGVVFSNSFYLDLNKIWEDREKLFAKDFVKQLEEAEKNPAIKLIGAKPSSLLKSGGAYHRVVVVDQPKAGYKTQPGQPIPAFAFVTTMRDGERFSTLADVALRGAALAATNGTPYKVKLAEEKHGDYTISGWRFPETGTVEEDPSRLRFNFSPCFVRVGNQFVVCSTIELCHQLIDILDQESRAPARKGSAAASESRAYGSGGAALLAGAQDTIIAQTVLDRAVTAAEAKTETQALIDLVGKLGVLNIDSHYEKNQYRFELRLKMAK